jgi:hypothetical protein
MQEQYAEAQVDQGEQFVQLYNRRVSPGARQLCALIGAPRPVPA